MRSFFQVSLILGFFSFILLWILPAHAEIGVHVKAPYNYSVSVSSSPQAYTINTPITFSVKVTNDGKFVIHDLDVIAPFSSLMAENIHGQSIVALNNISISSTQEGSNTDAGEYANTGDLSATNVSIGIGGSVTYSISATVADLLVGEISTQAKAVITERDQSEESSISVSSEGANVSVTNTLNKTEEYLVGDSFTYTIEVKNSGGGIASDYQVNFLVSQIKSLLANDLKDAEDSTDITAIPFTTWTNHLESIGEHSLSQLGESDSKDTDLQDHISIYPNEAIKYTVTVTTSSVSIDTIPEIEASVSDQNGTIVDSSSSDSLSTTLSKKITRTKTTSASEYVPGGEVEYTITVNNTDDNYFADNSQVIDDMTCIKTEQADGSTGQAFSEWKLAVKSKSGDGTDAGSFNYDVWTTNDISLDPDLAPAGEVVYTLTGKVSDTSVGKILDNSPDCGDNVAESGTGIKMPDANLYAKKEVSSHYYSAGHVLTYTITVTNSGDGFALDVPVVDELSKVTTTDIHGNPVPAYFNWTITAQTYDSSGAVSNVSDSGITSPIAKPNDLNVVADIAPHNYIVYTIEAITYPTANAEIRNPVVVDNTLHADVGSIPYDYDVSITKEVNGSDWISYSRDASELTYTITVTNPEGNGFASNVSIEDEISAIQAELLDPSGAMAPVFKSWEISSQINLLDPSLVYLKIFTDPGIFPTNYDGSGAREQGDIHIGSNGNNAAQIPAGVEIVYTIKAKIDRAANAFADSPILWGNFTNTATVSASNSDYSSPFSHSSSSDVTPNVAKIVVIKTVDESYFVPGEKVTFNVEVRNVGTGYANDIEVTDDINAMNFFDSWTITAETDHLGGTTIGNFADNQNINTTVDIAPAKGRTSNGETYGYIIYHITGIVKQDYSLDEASNTARVYDPKTDIEHKSSAQIGLENGLNKLNVSIVKSSDTHYIPGEEHEYTIYLQNNGEKRAYNLTFIDAIKQIKATLANKQDNHFTDYEEQSPFDSWSVNYDYQSNPDGFGSYTTDTITTKLNLKPDEIREIRVRAKVKDNAISKITNDAYIYQNKGDANEQSRLARDESIRADSGGDIYRYVNENYYSPVDTLIYKIEVTAKKGYYNNVKIQEDLNELSVDLMDGSTGNPFYNKQTGKNEFTVVSVAEDSHNGGTTDGTLDGTVADNTDIDTTVDVGAGDKVTFTVTGKVRPDAIGDINFGGDSNDNAVVHPYLYQLNFEKTTVEKNYSPGDVLTYHIDIENTGQGNARGISVSDELSTIMVATTSGDEKLAFQPNWTIEAVTSGEYPEYINAGTYADGSDLNTTVDIPKGSKLTYIIKATVIDDATGEILNTLKVNGDTVSTKTKPFSDRTRYSLDITQMFLINQSGDEITGNNLNRYMPGGSVEYTIRAENLNDVNIADIPVFDHFKEIETDYFDGTKGPAFDSWTIKATSDNSPVSNPGNVTDNQNIATQFTLAANSIVPDGSSYVQYIVKAHINSKAVGSIANVACFEADCGETGAFQAKATTIKMLGSNLVLDKQAYEAGVSLSDDGTISNATAKSTYSQNTDSNVVNYVISLKNDARGTEYGKHLKDSISEILTTIAEDSETDGTDPTGSPFSADSATTITMKTSGEKATDGKLITTVKTFSVNDVDIDTDLSLAPYGWINFLVQRKIEKNTLGEFTNTAVYDDVNKSATVMPEPSAVTVDKSIKTLGGKSYSTGMTYLPGDEVEYQVVVHNDSDNWANDVNLIDDLASVKVEVLGSGEQTAFSHTEITHTTSNTAIADTSTYVPSYTSTDSGLDIQVDIAPQDTLTFTIKATIRDDALGTITANTFKADSIKDSSDAIPPTPANITGKKALVSTSAQPSCTTADDCEYELFGEVVYSVTVTNELGGGIANDVSVVDRIDQIETESGTTAFSDYSVELVTKPASETDYSISGNYEGGVPLNASIDLKAGESLVFHVKGTVAANLEALDTISNTARVNQQDIDDTIVLHPPTSVLNLAAKKSTDTPTYVPGGEVRYYLDFYNLGNVNQKLNIKDAISSYQVETADGSMKTALKDWNVSAEIKKDGNPGITNVDVLNNVGANTDIDGDITLGATSGNGESGKIATWVRVTISGHVIDDAIGKFTNSMEYTDRDNGTKKTINLAQGFITPEPGSLAVTKTVANESDKYSPITGELDNTISFDVAVTNAAGGGYATNTKITDPLNSILTDLAKQQDPGLALQGEWTVTAPELGSNTKEVGTAINDETGFSGVYNIAPDETVNVHFSGLVVPEALGNITNIVNVESDNSGAASAQATYFPKDAEISIEKVVDKPEYSVGTSGEDLTYTITVKNTGGGWANDLRIEDAVSKISTDIAGDKQGKAFDSKSFVVSAQVSKITGGGDIYSVLPTLPNSDVDFMIDLAPNEQIVVTFKAALNNNVVGTVTNQATATYKEKTQSAEAISSPTDALLSIIKSVIDASGAEITDPTYEAGGSVRFKILVENKSDSFANDVHIVDTISSLKVTNNLGESEDAFTTWSTTVEASDPRSTITNFDGGAKRDLDYIFDIAPQSTAIFTITAKVQENAVDDIKNTAEITPSEKPKISSNEVIVKPLPSSYEAVKTSIETQYEPGVSLGFLVTITNNSKSYINNMIVTDDMADIQVDYVDGSSGPAFKPDTLSVKLHSSPADAEIVQMSATKYQVDIPQGKKVVFEVRGDVVDAAVGDIINIATIDNGDGPTDYPSNAVASVPSIVEAELTTDASYYVPGNTVEYHYIVKNSGAGLVKNVYIDASLSQVIGTLIDGTEDYAFSDWTISAETQGALTTSGKVTDNKNILTSVDIDKGGWVDYTITVTTNPDLISNIDVIGYYIDLDDGISLPTGLKNRVNIQSLMQRALNGQAGKVANYQLPPAPASLALTKTADKPEYENSDRYLTYTLTAENPSQGNASHVNLSDEISQLVAANGNTVFTSWDVRAKEYDDAGNVINSADFNDTNKDLNIFVDMKSNRRNRFEFTVIGELNKGLDDDITNTFVATLDDGTQFKADNTVHIKRIPDNTGLLTVTKQAFKDEAQVGDVVEYEVVVSNETESDFISVVTEDRMPGGFQYIADSSEITLAGSDNNFDTNDDVTIAAEPTATRELQYPSIDLASGEKVRVRYLLRVNIGATFGEYVNTAYAQVNNQLKSNLATATVKVTPDKLFDTASIIGKVYQDNNGDGYQADATAEDIEITADIDSHNYIAGSTRLTLEGKKLPVSDTSQKETNAQGREVDVSSAAVTSGIDIDELMGISRNRTLPRGNKAILEFKTKTRTPFDLHVTTDNGSDITLTADGNVVTAHHGDREDGLSAENLDVTRKLYRSGDQYHWKIIIENKGLYEEGIPGVRLITVEGIVIETDQYGRYHVPDQWVTDKKGKNFLVKLDTDSLPTGMVVISENPKVLRISPHALAKFNFSVQVADKK